MAVTNSISCLKGFWRYDILTKFKIAISATTIFIGNSNALQRIIIITTIIITTTTTTIKCKFI